RGRQTGNALVASLFSRRRKRPRLRKTPSRGCMHITWRCLFGVLPIALLAGAVVGYRGTVPESSEPVPEQEDKKETPPAVKALIEALKDKDADVRKNTAVALGRIGKEAKDAVPALSAALKDSETDVRGAAALALGRMGKEA